MFTPELLQSEYTQFDNSWTSDGEKRDLGIYIHNDNRDAIAVTTELVDGEHELVAKVDLAVLPDGIYVRGGHGDPVTATTILYALSDNFGVKMAAPPALRAVD